eukprot:GEMP01062953.1.p1 GENE.GEMP01062953.1~~GEMP01062953.1.p1  ORF type:complete len:110 (+),score=15.95 GEMP01062953.1:45-374(+)
MMLDGFHHVNFSIFPEHSFFSSAFHRSFPKSASHHILHAASFASDSTFQPGSLMTAEQEINQTLAQIKRQNTTQATNAGAGLKHVIGPTFGGGEKRNFPESSRSSVSGE